MSQTVSPHTAALHIAQYAIAALLEGALPNSCSCSDSPAVQRAMEIFNWQNAKLGPLRLLFDRVSLAKGQTTRKNYVAIAPIEDFDPAIPYPTHQPSNLANHQKLLRTLPIQQNWENLAFLSLVLEKYGACLSFGQPDANSDCDVALSDAARITGAVAAALASDPESEHLSLIAGDLSGIQNFIYTISSDGALKSLRARSFYLELVTEEVVQQVLTILNLPRTCVIYAGGGNLYLLAPSGVEAQVNAKCQELNRWLRQGFQGKVFLAIDTQTCAVDDVATSAFTQTWEKAIAKVNQQKTLKFADQLETVLKPQHSYEPCKVCHRDNEASLKPLNEPDSVLACSTCREMFQLGGKLFKTRKLVRSHKAQLSQEPIRFELESGTVYYHLFEYQKQVDFKEDILFLINNWNLNDYERPNTAPLLLGNYGKETEEIGESGFMAASEFAEHSDGIKRVGYLRMDVDRLGQIFAKGLNDAYSLPKLAGLSRQMSYFFKVYLNSLAEFRDKNFIDRANENAFKFLTPNSRPNLLFIYAGGDDLFVSGAWNEIVEFAFDVYQSFRAYTGFHPDITLSGGISLTTEKFPLYQAASEAGEAEEQGKGNGRDSLGLFGAAFKWCEWFGSDRAQDDNAQAIMKVLEPNDEDVQKKYWEKLREKTVLPPILGIFPFVLTLQQKHLGINQSRNFVRNLLLTAQMQERMKEDIDKKRKEEKYEDHLQDIKYYLHLPQIAYTLARLPRNESDDVALAQQDHFFRQSIMSPYNAPYFKAIATWIELLNRD